jgi:hypothetical protein
MPIRSVTKENERIFTIDGEIGKLKYYGYTEEEAKQRYCAETEYRKFRKGEFSV